MDKRNKIIAISAGGVFIAVLALSVVLFTLYSTQWHRYILFFPDYREPERVEGEIRRFRKHDDSAVNLEHLVREIMLGPGDLRSLPVVPKGTKLNSLIISGNKLYLDFNHEILFTEEILPFPLEKQLMLFSKSILWNFPDLEDIIFTINGEIPVDIIGELAENREEEKKK